MDGARAVEVARAEQHSAGADGAVLGTVLAQHSTSAVQGLSPAQELVF